jgi:hypothetical protein
MLALMFSLTGLAQAQNQLGPGPGMGYRSGMRTGPISEFNQDKDVIRLQEEIRQKNQELMALFTQSEVDEEKARNLHQEIVSLRTKLGEKRFDYMIAFKKRNPDWQPRFGGRQGRRDASFSQRGRNMRGHGPAGWNNRQSGRGPGARGNWY